tara:strand:+ start:209 stop:544 length:336 start_codon:yes stop_codon:yes gene_type:complete
VKDTDDESLVDGTDAGAVPATSTNTRTGYDGIFEFHKTVRRIEEERRMDLTGRTVHGVTNTKPSYYYYTPSEWSRSIGWDKVPDERNTELRGVKQDRRTDEDVSEESDTKT